MSRKRVIILATGTSALTVLNRAKKAGFASVTMFESAEEALSDGRINRGDIVLALLESSILTRDALNQCDKLGARTIGVVAHHRHRAWARLLPLRETVWLFAPAPMYRNEMIRADRVSQVIPSD